MAWIIEKSTHHCSTHDGVDQHCMVVKYHESTVHTTDLSLRKSHPSQRPQEMVQQSAVREITKSRSTFSATNISSNIVWLRQLHDTIQMKSNFGTNIVAFISQKKKNIWFFDYHLLTCSVRKMVLICLMQNIDMCLLYKSHQITRLLSHFINHFSKWMFIV